MNSATATTSQRELRHGPWLALVVIATGYFMNVLDSTVVNVALPSIGSGLHASTDQILWVVNAYLFPYAMLLLVAGRLGDEWGHRNMLFGGLLVFTVASVLCGLARSPAELIAARALQGMAAAAAGPQALAIAAAIFPPSRRGLAFGILAAVTGTAAAAGPALGGVVTSAFGWRWIFLLNLPVGLFGLLGTFAFVPATRERIRRGLGLGTVVAASVGLFAVLFALIEGQGLRWGRVWGPVGVIHLLVGGLLLLVGIGIWERARPEGLLPRVLFSSRNYALMVWGGVALSFGIFGSSLAMTLYLQSALHSSPLEAGLVLSPMWVASALVSPYGGRLSDRIGPRSIVTAGFGLFALGAMLTGLFVRPGASWTVFIVPLVVAGIGAGLVFAPLATVAMRDVAPSEVGGASGMLDTGRQVGGAVGIALVGLVLLASGARAGLMVTAGVLALAAASCLLIRRPDDAALPVRGAEAKVPDPAG